MIVISAVLAVLRPAWLIDPLQALVQSAGVFAPLVFMALVMATTPLHMSEVLIVMSLLIWSPPLAFGLSVGGSILGTFLTAALLSKIGGAMLHHREAWPPFLQRLADRVAQRPFLIGVMARVAVGTGTAMEAFFVATKYSKSQYLTASGVGIVLWVAQKLIGVIVARAAFQVSPWLPVALVLSGASVALIAHRLRKR
jgi:hypothetical protein